MYKFAIAYYELDEGVRVPLTGLEVRLVRPGSDFASGVLLTETVAGSGYYELEIASEGNAGYYEIWDDQTSPSGTFTGKTAVVGLLDGGGIRDGVILGKHLAAGAVTSGKIGSAAIQSTHIHPGMELPWANVIHYEQSHLDGVGDMSTETPPTSSDESVTHIIGKEYSSPPLVLLTPHCAIGMHVKSIVSAGGVTTIVIGLTNPDEETPIYTMVVVPV